MADSPIPISTPSPPSAASLSIAATLKRSHICFFIADDVAPIMASKVAFLKPLTDGTRLAGLSPPRNADLLLEDALLYILLVGQELKENKRKASTHDSACTTI